MGDIDVADIPTDDLGWDQRHELMRRMADEHGEWAGIPMPLARHGLVVEDRYPMPGLYDTIRRGLFGEPAGLPDGYVHVCPREIWYPVNEWVDERRGRQVIIETCIDETWEPSEGGHPGLRHRYRARTVPLANHIERLEMWLQTVDAADAWDIDAEAAAMDKLLGLVTPYSMRRYLLTGTFIEESPRSGVRYLFRRLRPTIATAPADKTKPEGLQKILAVLCMHPTAYYRGTWAGAMCPTDDVIAHLTTMRGDEPYFWRKATQHAGWQPEAGL